MLTATQTRNRPVVPHRFLQQKKRQGLSHPAKQPAIQPRLRIGPAHDKYEREADRMADKVVSMPAPAGTGSLVQRKCTDCAEEEKTRLKPLAASITPLLQRQPVEEGEPEQAGHIRPQAEKEEALQGRLIQRMTGEEQEGDLRSKRIQKTTEGEEEPKAVHRKPEGAGTANTSLEASLRTGKNGGRPLSQDTRHYMESRFGADFSKVRIHTDRKAIQMNHQIGAQAFTHGHHVYFNSGKYDPKSSSGKHLLAHELTHVIQQKRSDTIPGTPYKSGFSGISSYGLSARVISRSIKDCKKRKKDPDFVPKANECGPQSKAVDPAHKKVFNWILSKLIPERPLFLLNMKTLCNEHDLCYQVCNTDDHPLRTDKQKQEKCDWDFYQGALKQCEDKFGFDEIIPTTKKWYDYLLFPFRLVKNLVKEGGKLLARKSCNLLALLYYKAVSGGGAQAYIDGQEEACRCDTSTPDVTPSTLQKATVKLHRLLLTNNPYQWRQALKSPQSPSRLALLNKGTQVEVLSKDPGRSKPWNKTPLRYGSRFQWWYVKYKASKKKAIKGWVMQVGLSAR